MNGSKNQRSAAPSAIEAETLAAFDRMRADIERERAQSARGEARRIAALCAVVLRQCDEIAAIRAWREVAACTRDPFAWSSCARELPS